MNILKFLTPALCVLAIGSSAKAQAIYLEDFPHPGGADIPISTVGWANDLVSRPNRIFATNGGRVFAFANMLANEAFYTSTTLDTGATGTAFTAIDPTAYTFGVTFLVDISAGFSPDELRSRFAVQIAGGNWYISSTPLNVPLVTQNIFRNYSIPFNPAASGWNNLTVSGTGSPTVGATIGGPAASNLTGLITGVGLVVSYGPTITGGGTHEFDNFQVQPTARPGDVNLDTFVTLADLTIIRQNFRTAVTSRTLGDVTNDGFVNFDDFRQWKDNYVPAGVGANVSVPEPSAAAIVAGAACAIGWLRRRRNRST